MRKITVKIYQFDELSDTAKEKARDWYREGALDYEWYDNTFEDAKKVLGFCGFTIDKIYFSGFSSQGDGACFEGSWTAANIKRGLFSYAPKDKELRRLWVEARRIARIEQRAALKVKHSGYYYHENYTEFEFDIVRGELENDAEELAKDAMRWIYKQLNNEYNYLMSDESVDETMNSNEYEFTVDGKRA